MNAKWLKSKLTSAFSLIELMVVIAIVALLTAIAVPSYQGYLQQSKVTEIFSLASDQMNQWAQQYNLSGGTGVDIVNSTAEGSYIASTEQFVPGTTYTAPTSANCTAGSVGVVCIVLNSTAGTAIDPSLNGITLMFTPTLMNTANVSGDTTDLNITWACTFTGGATPNLTVSNSLLSSGGCIGS